MSGKRPSETAEGQQRVKRSRFGPVQGTQNGTTAPASTVQAAQNGAKAPAGTLNPKAAELLAKKEALKAQLQALREKKALSLSGQAGSSGAANRLGLGGVPIAQPASRPAPLRVDDQGREIDAQGNVIQKPKDPISSLKVNQRREEEARLKAEYEKRARAEDFFDASLGEKGAGRVERRQRKAFDFIKAGTFQKEAEQQRLKAAFGDKAQRELREKRENERKAAAQPQGDPNLIPLGVRVPTEVKEPEEPIPEVEWWDANLLQNKRFETVDDDISNLREDRITIYVEHPVPLEPPAEEVQPAPMPLPLTQKERKKLRTQRRLEKEKEKQELIRQGLLEPPKPKVKLSTFHRSLGVEASADPTAVEAQVRADQDARQQAHEDRNLANKLTPAERREKRIRKLTGAASEGEAKSVSVYRVNSSTTPQQNFKIRANAEELHMTGCAILTDSKAVIVVEGGPKAQKKYAHIVLNRIKWEPADADEDEQRPPVGCSKAWTGTVKTATFDKFVTETCRSEAAARKFLADRNIEQYWDLAMAETES